MENFIAADTFVELCLARTNKQQVHTPTRNLLWLSLPIENFEMEAEKK